MGFVNSTRIYFLNDNINKIKDAGYNGSTYPTKWNRAEIRKYLLGAELYDPTAEPGNRMPWDGGYPVLDFTARAISTEETSWFVKGARKGNYYNSAEGADTGGTAYDLFIHMPLCCPVMELLRYLPGRGQKLAVGQAHSKNTQSGWDGMLGDVIIYDSRTAMHFNTSTVLQVSISQEEINNDKIPTAAIHLMSSFLRIETETQKPR